MGCPIIIAIDKIPPRKVVSIHTPINSILKMPIFCLLCQRSSAEHIILKCAALVYWLFWIKGTWKMADAGWALWPSFLFLKVGDKTPMWKMSSLYQEEGKHSYQQWQGTEAERNLFMQTLLKWILSSVGSPYSYFSTIASLCSTYYKASRFYQFFGSHSLGGLLHHVKLNINGYAFLLLIFLCQFNSQAQLENPKRVEVKICLPYSSIWLLSFIWCQYYGFKRFLLKSGRIQNQDTKIHCVSIH